MAPAWTEENATHLLRRAGFGPSEKDVEKALNKGLDWTLATLFKPGKAKGKVPKKHGLAGLQGEWVARMVKSKTPLQEKLTLFWHDHFATAIHKVERRDYMNNHILTLYEGAYGPFKDLMLGIARDPAMLVWLDNRTNIAESPNENFARELMEVFSTGVLDKDGNPNYTEADVDDVARAFTGWTIKDHEFFFRANDHDEGIKTVKGVTGNLDGTDVIDILYLDPATSRRIPQKLWSFFAYPIDLNDSIADELQEVYTTADGHIGTVLEYIFRHDAFYSPTATNALVKSPVEYLVASIRMVGGKVNKKASHRLGYWLEDLGQSIYDPPSVFGWQEGLPWVATAGMLARADVAHGVADARDSNDSVKYKPSKLLGKKSEWEGLDAAGVVDIVLRRLGVDSPSASTRSALEEYAQKNSLGLLEPITVDNEFIDRKLRGLIALTMGSPEFQKH